MLTFAAWNNNPADIKQPPTQSCSCVRAPRLSCSTQSSRTSNGAAAVTSAASAAGGNTWRSSGIRELLSVSAHPSACVILGSNTRKLRSSLQRRAARSLPRSVSGQGLSKAVRNSRISCGATLADRRLHRLSAGAVYLHAPSVSAKCLPHLIPTSDS